MMKLSRAFFALGLIGLGVLGLIYGDFALQWQPVAAWVPARELLAYTSAAVLVAAAVSLLWGRTAIVASQVLFIYALLWLALLKLPHVALSPLIEATWMGAAEIVVIFAATWVLVASLSDAASHPMISRRSTRIAQLAFGASLIPLGISHFVYSTQTIGFVPSWLPFRPGWAYLGGAGHIAAGLGVLFGVLPRLAARLEAAMIGAFTILVWAPAAVTTHDRLQWTGFIISWIIAAAAWVVAESIVPTKVPVSIPLETFRAREASAVDAPTV